MNAKLMHKYFSYCDSMEDKSFNILTAENPQNDVFRKTIIIWNEFRTSGQNSQGSYLLIRCIDWNNDPKNFIY